MWTVCSGISCSAIYEFDPAKDVIVFGALQARTAWKGEVENTHYTESDGFAICG